MRDLLPADRQNSCQSGRGGKSFKGYRASITISLLGASLAIAVPGHAQGDFNGVTALRGDAASLNFLPADRNMSIADAGIKLAAQDQTQMNIAPSGSAFGEQAPDSRYNSLGDRIWTVKWEAAALAAFMTGTNVPRVIGNSSSFHFHNEGLFGHDTPNVGLDKLAHSYNAYIFSEVFYARMKRKTGSGFKPALASGLLAFGMQSYGELFDGFKKSSGWSFQDVGFNLAGVSFSVLRNSVPGLDEKLDFRLLVMPNREIYSFEGKEHFRQQRFLMALKLSGFEAFQNSPLRFVELQAGYSATGFTFRERARGETPQRKPFVGIGINVAELFFKNPRSRVERAARTGLEYVQIPYTAVYAR